MNQFTTRLFLSLTGVLVMATSAVFSAPTTPLPTSIYPTAYGAASPEQPTKERPSHQDSAPVTTILTPQGPAPKIIDVYTDWCGWCKRFEPFFKEAQSQLGDQIYFERMNAEAPENAKLVKKYRVNGFPTILFFNSAGKLVHRINGAPRSVDEFTDEIRDTFPSLH